MALRVGRAFLDRDRDGLLVFFVGVVLLCVAAAVYLLTHLLVAAAPVVMLASFVAVSRVASNASYPDISDEEVPSFEEMNEWGGEFESIYEGITFGIESYTECLGAAVRLRRVSSAWSRALLKRRAFLEERIDRLTSEKRTLKGIKRTAHAIYEEYYSDDLDFANY